MEGRLNILFCSDCCNSIARVFYEYSLINKSVKESRKFYERWEWSNETLGEVLSNGDKFAQGWVTSLYKVQKSRTRTSLLGECGFVNQIGCVSRV